MKWFFRILIVIIALAGIGLMGYPLLSNYLYEKNQRELIEFYERKAAQMPPEERNSQWEECEKYNQKLLTGGTWMTDPFDSSDEDLKDSPYYSLLNLDDRGAMGSLEVTGLIGPLVIYHGTGEEVLQKGVGHLKSSSLPVGGKGTHSVLSAHTGLNSKKLFTNLDRLEMGDVFFLSILGEKLAYQVDQIKIVLPYEAMDDLCIDPEQDYVTLITCTPYGINTHRLLVRGTRIPYEEAKRIEDSRHHTVSTWQLQYVLAIMTGVGIVFVIVIVLALLRFIRKRKKMM